MQAMKNGLGQQAISRINQTLSQVTDFDQARFSTLAEQRLEQLELKGRVNHFIQALHQCLPADFEQAAAILSQVADIWPDSAEQYQDAPHPMFAAWPLIDYAAVYGLAHPDTSLHLLKKLTPLFSAEFAIRPFILQHQSLCFEYFSAWVKDENEHVRRLVSEGTRPLLPWGIRLAEFVKDPGPNLPLLNQLKSDPSLYVRRSVANHLNDIAKNDPELVMKICTDWHQSADDNTRWLIKHACRGLIKAGHNEAFKLLGFTENPAVELAYLTLNASRIRLGDSLAFEFALGSMADCQQLLVVDYKIYFMRANGKQNSKVFKLKNITLNPGETLKLAKSHSFKPVTTRKYYPGEHKLEIMVNGETIASAAFELI